MCLMRNETRSILQQRILFFFFFTYILTYIQLTEEFVLYMWTLACVLIATASDYADQQSNSSQY